MRQLPPPIPRAPLFVQRRTVIVACAIAVFVTILAFAGTATDQILLGLATDGLFLLAWLAAAAGIGGMFFRLPRRVEADPIPVAAAAVATGTTKSTATAITRGGGGGTIPVAASRMAMPEFDNIAIP